MYQLYEVQDSHGEVFGTDLHYEEALKLVEEREAYDVEEKRFRINEYSIVECHYPEVYGFWEEVDAAYTSWKDRQ